MNATILDCLRANVTEARTKGLRKFAQNQLEAYLARPKRRARQVRPTPNWDRP